MQKLLTFFCKKKKVVSLHDTVKPAHVVTSTIGLPVLAATFSGSLKLKYSANELVLGDRLFTPANFCPSLE